MAAILPRHRRKAPRHLTAKINPLVLLQASLARSKVHYLMLERLLFRKVELWFVAIILVLALMGAILFGSVVLTTIKGGSRFGVAGELAVSAADIPNQAKEVVTVLLKGNKGSLQAGEQRFDKRAGFTFNFPSGSRPDLGYLVLARYDPEVSRSVAELVDLNTQKTVHRWLPDYAGIAGQMTIQSGLDDVHTYDAPDRVRMFHPLVLEDGSLVYNNYSPLVRVDACGRTLWTAVGLFHHSIEFSADGNIWAPSYIEPHTLPGVLPTFKQDAITKISRDGKIVFRKSIAEILIENDLGQFVYGHDNYSDDSTHLNDIQEVTFDGEYWKKGDLFINARNISAIILYRPSENKVIWYKQWDWVHQHDVDILDDHRISVFDNHKYAYHNRHIVHGTNDVKIYDFDTGLVSTPWAEAMKSLDVRTINQGRSEVLGPNDVYVEETNYGRAMMLSTNGDVTWEFINRGADGKLYILNWSRVLDRDYGDQVLKALNATNCP